MPFSSGFEVLVAEALVLVVKDLDRLGDDQLLARVAHGLVGEDEDGHAVLVREVEGAQREVEGLLHGGRGEGDYLIVAVAAVAGLA